MPVPVGLAWSRAAGGGLAGSRLGLPVGLSAGLELSRTRCPGGLRWRVRSVAAGRGAAGLFDGAQPGGDSGLAGCDGLAVASAVGAVGPVGAGPLDLAGVGFALAGVRGDGEHGDAGGGGGVLENVRETELGLTRRYWITL